MFDQRWRLRIAVGLVIAALVIRLLLFVRAVGWEPVRFVGDFATDYFPRAEFFAEHARPPRTDELPIDMYLRPPGTSLLLAVPVAAGADWASTIRINRVFNLVVDSLLLGAVILMLWRLTEEGWRRVGVTGFLLVQPWTAGFAALPGGDTLNMALLAMSMFGFAVCLGNARVHRTSRFAGWLTGLGLGGSLLLRTESIVWVPLLALGSLWLWYLAGRSALRLVAPVWLPVLSGLAICAGYSQYVRNSPDLWRSGPTAFAESGVNRWLRTWYGTEREKTNIAFYWFRGQNLTPSSVPPAAIRRSGQAEHIRALLMGATPGEPLSADTQAEFAKMALENREAYPFDYYVGIPLDHLIGMLLHASAFPESSRLLGRLYSPAAGVFVAAMLWITFVGCVVCLVPWRRAGPGAALVDFRLIALIFVAARLALFGVLLKYPENRYLLPCWPPLLMLAALGWAGALPVLGIARSMRTEAAG